MADVELDDSLKSKKVESTPQSLDLTKEKLNKINIELGNIEILKIKMQEETNTKLEKIIVLLMEINYNLSQQTKR